MECQQTKINAVAYLCCLESVSELHLFLGLQAIIAVLWRGFQTAYAVWIPYDAIQ